MRVRPAVATALLVSLAVAAGPAQAAKPKHRPIHGSYTRTLLPDPSPNATNSVGKPGCGLLPVSQDKHPFSVPAAGTLTVVLDSAEVGSSAAGTDWDLYVLDADGSILDSSHGGTAHEETSDKFKHKTDVTFWICNLAGEPKGTVNYTFTYA